MNKLSGFGLVERARALAPLIAREADEIERTRRLTRPVVVRADRERALPRAAAAESRRHRGAAGNLHADAGRDREGRCLHGMVPRPMQRLRHDRGLSRSRHGARDLQCADRHPGLGRDRRMRRMSFPAATAPPGAGTSPRGSRQASWLGAHVRIVEADGTPRKSRTARRKFAPSCFRVASATHLRRLGRDRAEGHRHRQLFGRQSLHPRTFRRVARRPQRRARDRARSTGSPPTSCSPWALPRSRSAWRAPCSMRSPNSPAARRRPDSSAMRDNHAIQGGIGRIEGEPARRARLSLCDRGAGLARSLDGGRRHRGASRGASAGLDMDDSTGRLGRRRGLSHGRRHRRVPRQQVRAALSRHARHRAAGPGPRHALSRMPASRSSTTTSALRPTSGDDNWRSRTSGATPPVVRARADSRQGGIP